MKKKISLPKTEGVEADIHEIKLRLDSHDKRFDDHDKRFDSIDKRFEDHDKRFDDHDKKFDIVVAAIQENRMHIDRNSEKIDSNHSEVMSVLDKILMNTSRLDGERLVHEHRIVRLEKAVFGSK